MKAQKSKTVYLTVEEAAARLGVDRTTVKAWVGRGRLKGKVEKIRVIKKRMLVEASSLATAFENQCAWCGKTFTSRHPEKAKYCCPLHLERARNAPDAAPSARRRG